MDVLQDVVNAVAEGVDPELAADEYIEEHFQLMRIEMMEMGRLARNHIRGQYEPSARHVALVSNLANHIDTLIMMVEELRKDNTKLPEELRTYTSVLSIPSLREMKKRGWHKTGVPKDVLLDAALKALRVETWMGRNVRRRRGPNPTLLQLVLDYGNGVQKDYVGLILNDAKLARKYAAHL